ncbi:hypothetical protein C2E23DRAFT_901871 [Lenzites betulinus]|nr:hypothetical protein C2E23DRAFT_901871 [Lenzites betulinus]
MQHTSTSDPPALALDDILHPMSPSPTPLPPESSSSVQRFLFDPNDLPTSIMHLAAQEHRATTPEPVDYDELESMRARVQEFALSHRTVEAELAAMVLRLISQIMLHPSPTQLALQADIIANLSFQRDSLLREREEELSRWNSEREAWLRTANVLSAKAFVAREPATRDPETQRYIARLEDDLKTSRRRTRLTAVERELSRLRPLLALHATILRDPQLRRPEHHSSLLIGPIDTDTHNYHHTAPNIVFTSATQTNVDPQADDGTRLLNPGLLTSQPSRTSKHRSDKPHRKERDKDRERDKKHRSRSGQASALPLLADARAECILVAARKLGRLRAGVVSGFIKERTKPDGEHTTAPPVHPDPGNFLLSPPTPQQRPRTVSGTPARAAHDTEARSSSPPVPLSAAYQPVPGPKSTQRRLAPSPFPPAGPAHAHAHPSMQPFPVTAHGRHPQHPLPHPGFMYFAPPPGSAPGPSGSGSGGGGGVPFVMPVSWATVPGTPPGAHASSSRHAQSATNVHTPSRTQGGAPNEGASTPMDSLVNAARTLIEDEDYDGDGPGEGAQTDVEADLAPSTIPPAELEEVQEEAPMRRRGTRRRAPAAPPDSPLPKRRRVGGGAANGIVLPPPPEAGPSTARAAPRRGRAAAAVAPPPQEKPKARGRAKGKGKAKDVPAPAPAAASGTVRAVHAPQVARIRSALDVLADQAAQEQERLPSLDVASRRGSESEGREEGGGMDVDAVDAAAEVVVVGEEEGDVGGQAAGDGMQAVEAAVEGADAEVEAADADVEVVESGVEEEPVVAPLLEAHDVAVDLEPVPASVSVSMSVSEAQEEPVAELVETGMPANPQAQDQQRAIDVAAALPDEPQSIPADEDPIPADTPPPPDESEARAEDPVAHLQTEHPPPSSPLLTPSPPSLGPPLPLATAPLPPADGPSQPSPPATPAPESPHDRPRTASPLPQTSTPTIASEPTSTNSGMGTTVVGAGDDPSTQPSVAAPPRASPLGGPAEIESGDEDAEGSVVDETDLA